MTTEAAPAKRKTKPKIEIDLAKVERLAERGLSQEEIARSLGISERTLINRKKENAEFSAAIARGRDKGHLFVANKLMEQIQKGNVGAMQFYLARRCGWNEQIKHSDPDGEPLKPTVIQVQTLPRGARIDADGKVNITDAGATP